MKTERGVLWLSLIVALLMAVVGVGFALATHSRVILLDGLYNTIYFLVGLFTLRVAHLAGQPDSARFPFGHGYFESLVNAAKGLLILGISLIAVIDSMMAILDGGREIASGLAIAYAVFATVICSATAITLRRSARTIDSPLVHADVANWVLNAVISGALIAGFCMVPLLRYFGWHEATAYVDPVLVAALVLLLIGMPVRMARQAILELLNRAPGDEIRCPVTAAVDRALAGLPVRERHVRLVRPGRTLYVLVHVVLPADWQVDGLGALDAVRERIEQAVRAAHPRLLLDVVFTADPYWAAPNSGVAALRASPARE